MEWADRRHGDDSVRMPTRLTGHVEQLTPPQTAAVAAVVGSRPLELMVGPAGTGKTTTLATAARHLQVQHRPSFGVAPTAAAAEVLAAETGMAADTLDKLLTEHRHPTRPPQPEYDLRAGTTVIVDEAGTAATPKLAELARLAEHHGWRIVLVGDPRQFSAVGRGGMFAHLVDSYGGIELDEVHRFRRHWERQASLRLRIGDATVLTEYERRGRLHGGTLDEMEADIIAAWREARGRGDSVALMANSTDTVATLNQLAQQICLVAGELDPTASRLQVDEAWMLVGDEVVTRRNNRRFRTDRGFMVKNRDHWTITDIQADDSVALSGRTGSVRLPAEYVRENLELGYAQTSHATQGRTVDTALLLIDTPTDRRGIYTPMTRGRDSNHVYVVVEDNKTALDVVTETIVRDWVDQPAVARRAQLGAHRSPQVPVPGDEEFERLERHVRDLIEERRARIPEAERTPTHGFGLTIN